MPRHDEGYVPAPKSCIVPCSGCGAGIEVGWKRRTPSLCIECACERRTAAMIQMHGKVGPYYEKWKAGMREFLIRELGIDTTDPANVPDRFSSA